MPAPRTLPCSTSSTGCGWSAGTTTIRVPETGLSEDFFDQQNALFASRGLALYSFIPGEVSFRAPLFLGLPTLEGHRHRNAYVTYLETGRGIPAVRVVCAEGVLHPNTCAGSPTSSRPAR